MTLLRVENLDASYGRVRVLNQVAFTVDEGQTVVMLGANGAGKTTTLRAICGITQNRGTVQLDGTDITHASTSDIVRKGVAHVPQGRGTFANLTVAENLRLGSYLRRDSEIADDLDRCYSIFPRLAERSNQQAGSLSGGEQQMLAVARGLMLRPRLLLLDEPSLGLAPVIVQDLFTTLAQLRDELDLALLIVEQNADLALAIADYAYVLETGSIVSSGPAADVKNNDVLRRAYLGL